MQIGQIESQISVETSEVNSVVNSFVFFLFAHLLNGMVDVIATRIRGVPS